MGRRLPRDAEAWEQLCSGGLLIARGALNDAYRVSVDNRRYFVRQRKVFDSEYGQTFAGERYVPPQLAASLGVPELLDVVADKTGRETFAIFEWVPGRPATAAIDPDALARLLVEVHVPAAAFGDILGPHARSDAPAFLAALLDAEVGRLDSTSGMQREAATAGRAVLAGLECFRYESVCLCHGDVHAGNVLVEESGRLRLVDWEAVRYRVAAADFNQLHHEWLTDSADCALIARYAELTGRDVETFSSQVRALRCLWHIRTFNFHVLVRREPVRRHQRHLEASVRFALSLVEG
jgi:aminoglycoside phosphotransferase (APT) family kinase protein